MTQSCTNPLWCIYKHSRINRKIINLQWCHETMNSRYIVSYKTVQCILTMNALNFWTVNIISPFQNHMQTLDKNSDADFITDTHFKQMLMYLRKLSLSCAPSICQNTYLHSPLGCQNLMTHYSWLSAQELSHDRPGSQVLGSILLLWINCNPSMDKKLHPLLSVAWPYISISKFQLLHHWNLGRGK